MLFGPKQRLNNSRNPNTVKDGKQKNKKSGNLEKNPILNLKLFVLTKIG